MLMVSYNCEQCLSRARMRLAEPQEETVVDEMTLEVKLLLAASLLAAWLGLRQQRYAGSTRYAYLFGILLLSAGLRHVGVWH